MEEVHREIIRSHSQELVNDLEPAELMQFLFQKKIFNRESVQNINSERTRENKSRELLSLLERSGPNAFSMLIEGLEKNKPWLAEMLLKEEEQRLSDVKRDKSQYCRHCHYLEMQIEDLKGTLQRSEDTKKDLEKECNTRSKTEENLRIELEHVQKRLKSTEQKKSEYSRKCTTLEENVDTLKSLLQRYENEKKELTEKFDDCKTSKTNLENKLTEVNTLLEGAEGDKKKIMEYESKLQHLTGEKEIISKRAKILERDLNHVGDKLERTERDKSEYSEKFRKLEEQKETLERRLQESEDEKKDLKKKCNDCSTNQKNLEVELKDVTNRLERAERTERERILNLKRCETDSGQTAEPESKLTQCSEDQTKENTILESPGRGKTAPGSRKSDTQERQWLSAEEGTMLSDQQTQSRKEKVYKTKITDSVTKLEDDTSQCNSNLALQKRIETVESTSQNYKDENNDLLKKVDESSTVSATNGELQIELDDANTRLKRDDCDKRQSSCNVSEQQIDETKSTLQSCHDERKEQRDFHSPGPSQGKGTSASRSRASFTRGAPNTPYCKRLHSASSTFIRQRRDVNLKHQDKIADAPIPVKSKRVLKKPKSDSSQEMPPMMRTSKPCFTDGFKPALKKDKKITAKHATKPVARSKSCKVQPHL